MEESEKNGGVKEQSLFIFCELFFMSVIQSVLLGILQGLTEFLPISSSGHLIFVPEFLNWPDQGLAYDAVLHLATGLAIIFALKTEIGAILKNLFKSSSTEQLNFSRKFFFLILLATIPAGLAGLLFEDLIDAELRNVEVVALSLFVWAVVLWLAEKYNNQLKIKRGMKGLKLKDSLWVGLMQVLALIPGTSRSGITITAGMLRGVDKKTAVNFSFLVGLPLILAAGILKFYGLMVSGQVLFSWPSLMAGFLSAFISGLIAIKILKWLAANKSFKIFVIYRIILSLFILLMLA